MPTSKPAGASRAVWFWAAAALTALVFSRSLAAGFLNFDDQAFLVNNPHFHGFTAENIAWMFGRNWILWYPVTWLTYALDYSVWGLNPAGYHLTNVLLHALNAGLAFALFDRLMEKNGAAGTAARRAAAAFGALFFAAHPLRVESVAWASERSDVLSASFALATALAWIDGRDGRALLLHALALGSKAVCMPVPLALGLLDVLRLSGRPWRGARRETVRLAPMLLLSAADGAVSASSQARVGAAWSWARLGGADRLAIAAWNYAHGVVKTLWPAGLMGLYPMPRPFDRGEPRFLLAAILVLLLTALAWRLRRRAPAFAAAWGAYLLILAPSAGFLKIGNHLMADRYTYLSMLGFAGLAAEGARRAFAGARPRAAGAAAAALIAALAASAWSLQGDWLDSDRFWGAMAAADPRHAVARTMLSQLRLRENRPDEAERLLREAAAIDPADGGARNALANLLENAGRHEEAAEYYRAAIRLEPDHAVARYNLALSLLKLGRREEAAAALREELALIRRARGDRPADPLRAQLALDPDEKRTADLLKSIAPGKRF